MPVYPTSPHGRNVVQAVPGWPCYLLGSYAQDTANTKMNVSSVALAGTTATVVGTVVHGNIPLVGQLITIFGATPTYFNVTAATILTVSSAATPDVGVFTVTFSLTNSNIGTTVSTGEAVITPVEVGESITLGGLSSWNSIAASLQEIQGPNVSHNLMASVRFPTALGGSCTVTLQGADSNVDGNFKAIGSAIVSAATANATTMFAGTNAVVANFVRFAITSIVSPGSGKIVGTILVK